MQCTDSFLVDVTETSALPKPWITFWSLQTHQALLRGAIFGPADRNLFKLETQPTNASLNILMQPVPQNLIFHSPPHDLLSDILHIPVSFIQFCLLPNF